CSIRFAPIVFIPSTLVILHLLGNETALPLERGKQENPVPSPIHRGGLGWGNADRDGKLEN
ncbi:MAG: hypothetical protein V7K92_23210, partial [Nostoc sp.]|uniref:hypothetical protein n=1 Tax=Nostoc sp. TaxID=1180 RepID=UPI002FF1A65E